MAGVSVKTCSNIPVVRPYGLALCVRPFRQTALVKAAAHRHELPRRVSNTSVGRVEAKANAGPLFRAQQFIRNNIVKVIGAVALACFMVRGLSGSAEAASSAGRMGGSGFSGRSMGGGGYSAGRLGGSSFGPSMRAPSLNRSYEPSYSNRGVGAPVFGFGYSPFGFGYGAPVVVSGGGGGGSAIFGLLVVGLFTYLAFNAITSSRSDDYDDGYDIGNEPMSVVKLQVGLMGSARGLQRDLNRMGNSIDTSTPEGLHYLLTETVLALRRNPQYALYGKAELEKTRGLDNAEAKFNKMCMNERSKFKRETLSNVGGRTYRSVANVQGDGINELIVVTLIAAIDGKVQPAPVYDQEGLKENLNLLGSVPKDNLLALEVMWTPQDENDYYTKEELVTDYPTLNML